MATKFKLISQCNTAKFWLLCPEKYRSKNNLFFNKNKVCPTQWDDALPIVPWMPSAGPEVEHPRSRSRSPQPIHSADPQSPTAGPPMPVEDARPITNLDMMERGSVCKPEDVHLKKPAGGERSNAVLITWSRPRGNSGFWRAPGERSEFAKILGEAVDIINKQVKNAGISIKCAVFQEKRAEGGVHNHAILGSQEPTVCWNLLDGVLRKKSRVACHIRVGVGRGFSHIEHMLRYLMAPSVTKWDLDPYPFFSPNFDVPRKILAERSKAYNTLKNRSSPNDEVFEWLKAHPDIKTFNHFSDYVDEQLETKKGDIGLARLSKFISKNTKDGQQIVDNLINRRDRAVNKDLNTLGRSDFMGKAWKAACTCPSKNKLRQELLWSVEWRDHNERLSKNSKGVIGDYAANLYFDTFQDRKENICASGIKGTGKTTVLHAFENIVPPHRIFAPTYGSGAPFSGLADHHLLGSLQEFRCRPNIDCATVLLWLERKEDLKIDVKHQDPVVIKNGGPRCIVSSNYLRPSPGWQAEDIEAFYDRCACFYWNLSLPQEQKTQAARNKCQRCSVGFLAACSPKLLSSLESTFGPHGRKKTVKKQEDFDELADSSFPSQFEQP